MESPKEALESPLANAAMPRSLLPQSAKRELELLASSIDASSAASEPHAGEIAGSLRRAGGSGWDPRIESQGKREPGSLVHALDLGRVQFLQSLATSGATKPVKTSSRIDPM